MTGPGEFGTEATISRLQQGLVDAEQHNRQLTERLRFYRDAVAEAAQLTGAARHPNEDLVSWLLRGLRAASEVMPASVRARIRLIESGPAAKSIRGRRAGDR